MNKMDELKKQYKEIEIPAELSQVVREALEKGKPEAVQENQIKEKGNTKIIMMSEKIRSKNANSKKKAYRKAGSAAAAAAILIGAFAVGVNTSDAFASSFENVPLLNSLVRVFTGEAVNNADDVCEVKMALPKVEGLTDKKLEARINEEIEEKMNAVVQEAKLRFVEDKKAYLETGGTEAEYNQRKPEVVVDYQVKNISDRYLSFVVEKTETAASAYFEQYFYNIDLKNNKELSLKDLLGEDYITTANIQIKDEITERAKNPDAVYWGFGSDDNTIEGFQTISKNQSFYINEAGNPVIVFNKYEIGPGFMGIQEFEITK